MYKILTIDGGGARGYFVAYILKRMKDDYNINYSEYFDMIAGTSTGSLIAGALGLGIEEQKIVDVYLNRKDYIFQKQNYAFFKRMFNSKYDNKNLINELRTSYENRNFQDVKTNILITATDLQDKKPVVFKSWDSNDVSLIDAIVSSSAAPSYFDPYAIKDRYYIDGSMWANNPCLIALKTAVEDFDADMNNIKILSIGTGTKKDMKVNTNNWGLFNWSTIITDVFIKAGMVYTNDITKCFLKDRFVRLNFKIDDKTEMDELSTEMINKSEKIYQELKPKIEKFLEIEEEKEDKVVSSKKYNKIQKLAIKLFRLEQN